MAKNILFITCFFFSSFSLYAQINKKQFIVGGITNFSYSNTKGSINEVQNNYKKTSLQLSSDVGYFIINQLCAGVRIGISISNDKQVHDGQKSALPYYISTDSKVSSINISPFIRYYFLDKNHKVNILSDVGYSFNFNREESQMNSISTDPNNGGIIKSSSLSNSKYFSNSFTIAAGPVLFLNPKTSLELTVGYNFSKQSELKTNTLLLGAGFHVHLGKSE